MFSRISLNGNKFTQYEDGKRTPVADDSINVVIVSSAPVSRTYYKGEYDPDRTSPPTCWSATNASPSPDVPPEQRQSIRCLDCVHNHKGSGSGGGRAGRFVMRLAIALEDDLDKIHQLQLPATSVFGDAKNGNMPMQAYSRHLRTHKTPAISVVTNVYFDADSYAPKLFFKPIRPLEENELGLAHELASQQQTTEAISMSMPVKRPNFAEVNGFVYTANAN